MFRKSLCSAISKAAFFNGSRQYAKKIRGSQKLFIKDSLPPTNGQVYPLTKFGGQCIVTLLIGSPAGYTAACNIKTLFQQVNAPVEFEEIFLDDETALPDEYLMAVTRNGAALHVDEVHETDRKQKSIQMNTDLDLFAGVVNCQSFPGLSKHPSVNIAIIMQNNTGDFSKLEYEPVKGIVETLRFYQDTAVERYLNFVFKYTLKNGRRKITFAHKSDELPLTDSMHIAIANKLKNSQFPQIQIEEMQVNEIVRNLIMKPYVFDVICTNEKYGTFLTSICSAVCGGASLFSAKDYGYNRAVFKPLQTKLSITEKCSLSPYGVVSSGVSLLYHLNFRNCAQEIWNSLMKTITKDKILTEEFGGDYSDDDVICYISKNLQDVSRYHTIDDSP